ncbi:MAG: hypothetical protein U5L09_12950 [Bacteroidales bacterium]|nr:hypothetical protein [Bacteroidales bacterium]
MIVVVFLVPFFWRNYYLAGYLVFPYSNIDLFNVDWKIPIEVVENAKNWIQSWARIPKLHYKEVLAMPFQDWFGAWFTGKNIVMKGLLLTNLVSLAVAFVLFLKRKFKPMMIILINVLNLVFWFSSAPDPRFVYGFIIIGFSLTIALLLSLLSKKYYFTRLFLLLIVASLIVGFSNNKGFIKNTLKSEKEYLFPKGFSEYTVMEKLVNFPVYKPVEDNRCFDAPLPCSPNLKKNLFLRGETIESGFYIKKN